MARAAFVAAPAPPAAPAPVAPAIPLLVAATAPPPAARSAACSERGVGNVSGSGSGAPASMALTGRREIRSGVIKVAATAGAAGMLGS
jgi:hypothetical protein